MSAAQPNHGGRGPHGDLRGPEPGLVPQRTGPGPVIPGGLQGRQGPQQAGIPGLMQQGTAIMRLTLQLQMLVICCLRSLQNLNSSYRL